MAVKSFKPEIDNQTKILILGTMPGGGLFGGRRILRPSAQCFLEDNGRCSEPWATL